MANDRTNCRTASKGHWAVVDDGKYSAINAGSFQRIADATELMAKNYQGLVNERDLYLCWYKESQARNTKKDLRIAALKGVITKLKKAPKQPGSLVSNEL